MSPRAMPRISAVCALGLAGLAALAGCRSGPEPGTGAGSTTSTAAGVPESAPIHLLFTYGSEKEVAALDEVYAAPPPARQRL
jgi:hypothetical protein